MPSNKLEIEQTFTTFIINKDAQKGKPIISINSHFNIAANHQINFKAVEPYGEVDIYNVMDTVGRAFQPYSVEIINGKNFLTM